MLAVNNESNPIMKISNKTFIIPVLFISSFLLIIKFFFKFEKLSHKNEVLRNMNAIDYIGFEFYDKSNPASLLYKKVQSRNYKGSWNSTNINSEFMHNASKETI